MWRIGDLCPRRGAVSARSLALGGGRVAQMNAMSPCDIHGDFEVFQITGVIGAGAGGSAAAGTGAV